MELKQPAIWHEKQNALAFNRTSMELKLIQFIKTVVRMLSFNRTSMELKQWYPYGSRL